MHHTGINTNSKNFKVLYENEEVEFELTEEFITERVDYAIEYFFNEGINEEGLDLIIEEVGIDEFTAIINPNDACILAVGGIKNTPVVKNGEIVPGNVMKVTLSCDHRIVDGAIGSAFLKTLKELIEDPIKILV